MKRKHFFTPLTSITWEEAENLVVDNIGEVVILDVRQPREYKEDHFPGAKLLPLGDLDNHLGELDRDNHIVAY